MPLKKKKTASEPKEIMTDNDGENSPSVNIDATIKAIQTKFGEGAIMKMGDTPKVGVGAISTGSLGLDAALGIGGLPKGRIIEIFGPESSGKTTLALHVVSEAQKRGGVCAYIDAEHAMDPDYSKKAWCKY
jgi:recombination protein RecA